MKCPSCEVDLLLAERQGVEIDYCPRCRGVWLDRGELDKIVERAGVENAPVDIRSGYPDARYPESRHGDGHHDGGHHGDFHQQRHYGQKKKQFLGGIFDFD